MPARTAPAPPPSLAVRVAARLVVLIAGGLVVLAVANVTAAAQHLDRPAGPHRTAQVQTVSADRP